jgi:hypothetical protein
MKYRETRNLWRVRSLNFRHKHCPEGIASQMEVIRFAPLRRVRTLQLDREYGGKVSVCEGSNIHDTHLEGSVLGNGKV